MFNTQNLSHLVGVAKELATGNHDTTAAVADLTFDSNCNLTRGRAALKLTDYAMGQVCDRLGPPPRRYIKQCPPHIQSVNLEHWRHQLVAQNPDAQWLVRGHNRTCRALLSTRYVPLDNQPLLETVSGVLADTSYTLVAHHLDGDSMHLRLTMANSPDGYYAAGVFVANSEIGQRSITLAPFVQRHSCANSIVHLDGGVRQRHVRVTPAFIWGLITEKVGQCFGLAQDMIERAVWAQAQQLPDVGDVIRKLCEAKGYTEDTQANILMGTEGQHTRMGLVNGLSAAARDFENPDQRLVLESMAGAILVETDPVWSVIQKRVKAKAEVEA